jgi:hypothetical protein
LEDVYSRVEEIREIEIISDDVLLVHADWNDGDNAIFSYKRKRDGAYYPFRDEYSDEVGAYHVDRHYGREGFEPDADKPLLRTVSGESDGP